MKIYLMRHYKVDHNWRKLYTSSGFDTACRDYDNAAILTNENVLNLTIDQVYTSTLFRSNATAEALGIDTTITTDVLNEVPIQSFMESTIPIPTVVWFAIGRLQWYYNAKRQVEGKQDTIQRIRNFMTSIEMKKQDCLIIGHGFYFSQMKKVLKERDYKGSNALYYKNGQIVTFENKNIRSM